MRIYIYMYIERERERYTHVRRGIDRNVSVLPALINGDPGRRGFG